jgi:hypothetical protein
MIEPDPKSPLRPNNKCRQAVGHRIQLHLHFYGRSHAFSAPLDIGLRAKFR